MIFGHDRIEFLRFGYEKAFYSRKIKHLLKTDFPDMNCD